MCVPQMGSELAIEFPYNDQYAAFYTGYWRTVGTASGAFGENYPNTYGHQDGQGTGYRVNMGKRFAEAFHASGARVEAGADGSATVQSPTKLTLRSLDGKTALVMDMVNGTFEFKAKEQTEIAGDTFKVTANKVVYDVASVEQKIGGGRTVQCTGGSKETVGGGKSESVVGSKAAAVGGNLSEIIGLQRNEILGLGLLRTIVAGGILDTILLGNHAESIVAGNYLMTVLAGTLNITTAAGIMNLTSGAAMNVIAALLTETIAGAKTETIGSLIQTIAAAAVINATGAWALTSAAAINLTAGAALNAVATGPATLAGSITNLGTAPAGMVVTTLTSPLIDLITGAPQLGCTTVLAGP